MDWSIRGFWVLVFGLLGASVFFGRGVAMRAAEIKSAPEASLVSGEIVSLAAVVDGDSVVVRRADGETAQVRILGIKAFPAEGKDAPERFGKAAAAALGRALEGKPARVLLHTTPKDRHGRFLASLYVDDRDVGLGLVEKGLALVYTVHPFPAMSLYLREQDAARAERRGLWGEATAAERADSLARAWRRQAE